MCPAVAFAPFSTCELMSWTISVSFWCGRCDGTQFRKLAYFDDVEFEYSQMQKIKEGTPVIEFAIQGTLS